MGYQWPNDWLLCPLSQIYIIIIITQVMLIIGSVGTTGTWLSLKSIMDLVNNNFVTLIYI